MMETNSTPKKPRVDVENILAAKNLKLPKFVVRYLKRIIHQDEINDFLTKSGHKHGIDFANAAIEMLNVKIKVNNPENVPVTGRYIIVSNHPLGGLDGIALISTFGKVRKDIFFPANDLLLFLKNMNNIFIPLNKHGRNTHEGIQQFNSVLDSDALVLFFPAGLCSRKQKNEVCDLEWKKTVVTKARQYKRDIIPVYFNGHNSHFFYNLANFRKFFRIKTNLEMLYLSDEMFKHRNKSFEITVGKPISYETFTTEKRDLEWSAWLKEKVYSLKPEIKKKKTLWKK
ncbi:MAG: 1-acyl-sn-glycerol-3-phosphate acyltransferase [Bacteroidales bacterium]|nr:1-acyl-sn-glycerol-3-phosphate acyltransferase [Bacteroidales bacterium]